MGKKFGQVYSVFILQLFFILFGMIKYSYGSSIIDANPGAAAVSKRSTVQMQAEDVDFKENLNGKEPSKEKRGSSGAANPCSPAPVRRLNQVFPGQGIPNEWVVTPISGCIQGQLDGAIHDVKDYPGGFPPLFSEPRQYTELNSIALDHYNRNQFNLGQVLGRLVLVHHSRHFILVGDHIVKWINPRYATSLPALSWSQQSFTVLIETGPDNLVSRNQTERLATLMGIVNPSHGYNIDIKYLFDIYELTSEVDKGLEFVKWSPAKIANIDEMREELCLLKPPAPRLPYMNPTSRRNA